MGLYADKIFPWVLDATEAKEMAKQRSLILSDVKGEILEIGIGTGVNLPYYPKSVRKLTVIEPSDAMRPRARIQAGKTGQIIEWHQGRGEEKIRKQQVRLYGLSKAIACGCPLTRDIEAHIRKSNFVIDELVHVPPFSGMNGLYTHIRGIATK